MVPGADAFGGRHGLNCFFCFGRAKYCLNGGMAFADGIARGRTSPLFAPPRSAQTAWLSRTHGARTFSFWGRRSARLPHPVFGLWARADRAEGRRRRR
jgi:hypothetical protein